jgi:hypothetical protein
MLSFALCCQDNWKSTLYICLLICSILVQPTSAQGTLDSLEQNCGARNAYDIVTKLLAVYASHIITIKIQPGIGTWKTFESYLLAGLLPSASTAISLRDLFFRRSSFRSLKVITAKNKRGYYENMQKAINAGGACFRTASDRVWSGHIVPEDIKVRAKPLDPGDVFVMIPRGTPAHMFRPIMVEGGSQLVKALIGAIQLIFATFQLISTNNPQISAYGYGSFVYTIIPYAFGSLINFVGAIMTDIYPDLTELEPITGNMASPEREIGGQLDNSRRSGSFSEDPSTQNTQQSNQFLLMDMEHQLNDNNNSVIHTIARAFREFLTGLRDHRPESGMALPPDLRMKSEDQIDKYLTYIGIIICALYLTLVGALSRFHNGISSQAERGWFLSWGIVGTIYGLLPSRIRVIREGSSQVIICQEQDKVARARIQKSRDSLWKLLSIIAEFMIKLTKVLVGAVTIGGIATMVKQYLRIYEC